MTDIWTLLIWLLYTIAWGLCEGGNVITPDSEAVFYGVLDFCAKSVFSIALIIGHWNIRPARMGSSSATTTRTRITSTSRTTWTEAGRRR